MYHGGHTLIWNTLPHTIHSQNLILEQARDTFLRFFQSVNDVADSNGHHKCACPAKVFQAFALFEMKKGNAEKSLQLIQMVEKMDDDLRKIALQSYIVSNIFYRKLSSLGSSSEAITACYG